MSLNKTKKTAASNYMPTVGIECHVQLKTKTKLFAAVGNDARHAAPNTLISHICVGMPGALPVLNEEALVLASRAAFALNTRPQAFSKFDRKHYFYPDLPKGYQITQYDQPIIVGGNVQFTVEGQGKQVGIIRAHLEEDAGKNIHPPGTDYSLVDLNRTGTPLLEIVSAPDIHSGAEAKAFAREMYMLMKYADVSDCDLYHGNMRFDVNVSVSNDSGKLGTRTEIKNLNSFRGVEGAVGYEIERQTEILEKGGEVIQETRGWDETKQKTIGQRGKEEAHDYRYMPEPDVPPVELTEAYIKEIESGLPRLPGDIRAELGRLNIDTTVIEDILDRPAAVRHSLQVLDASGPDAARRTAFWFLHGEPSITEHPEATEISVKPARLVELSKMVDDGELSSTAARAVFDELAKAGGETRVIAERLNLKQVSDLGELQKFTAEVLAENQPAAEDVKKGETKAIGFLVGQVMKKSQGRANPARVQEIIRKQLGL